MKIQKIEKFLAVVLILQISLTTAVCQTKPQASGDNGGALPQIVNFDKPPTVQINAKDLPKPYASESVRRGSRIVPQPKDARLSMPKRFKISVFAEGGFTYPRWMALAPNGDVFVADSRANAIVVLRDKNKDGAISADERFTFADNLSQPFGMAFHQDWFYVANTDSVVRFKYKSGQTKAETAPEKIIELTEGGYNQHWTRNILFAPDGKKLYVSIGSSGNVDVEKDERRAGISEYNPDGSGYRLFASGLRTRLV
jgi:glucose/arabinose dehydrogenase